ncbi:MAG: hypothetical protein QMD11_07965 [Smithella sp.]|nr:hypothetical protein [Smithella sp.]
MTKEIDLASLDTIKGSNKGFDVWICHPSTNEDLGIIIHVLGKDSDEYQQIIYAQNDKRVEMKIKNAGTYLTRRGYAGISTEEVAQGGIELLAGCTKSWSGVVLDGISIDCTYDNAIMIYKRFPWIKEQVDTAIGDRANFIKL